MLLMKTQFQTEFEVDQRDSIEETQSSLLLVEQSSGRRV